jgi:hypothetical protein
VARQRDPVRAEGVGLDDLGAGVHVVAVHGLDQLGLADVELVVAARVQHAALVEQRAHRAVEEKWTSREGFGEWLHRELGTEVATRAEAERAASWRRTVAHRVAAPDLREVPAGEPVRSRTFQ